MTSHMTWKLFSLTAVAALAACSPSGEEGNAAANEAAPAGNAVEANAADLKEAEQATLAEAVAGSVDHKTLSQALKAAGLETTLAGPGPYTIFAPSDPAFAKLPADNNAETLLKPESKAKLTGILTYHVVPGAVTVQDLAKAAEAAGGTAQLATLGGGNLRIAKADDSIIITDAKGGQARVTQADLRQSNGMLHVVDTVLMPN